MHEFGAGTHVGNARDNNEDSYVCDPSSDLWIVADGMGGLGFGEVASAISTYTVARQVKDGHGINQAIELAHKKIKEYAETEANGTNMGTTMVLLLSQGSLYNVFWVGDSRAYLFDSGKISQLTTDHSLVQSLIEQGELTAEEAISDPRKNVVTRALGVQEMETVRADSVSEKWQSGQKILLCSDGLTDCVRKEDIEAILKRKDSDQEKVDALIESALNGGGNDNITIVLVSASNAAMRSDSDTHVPTDITDSTLVPNNDNTAVPPASRSNNDRRTNNRRASDRPEKKTTDNTSENLKRDNLAARSSIGQLSELTETNPKADTDTPSAPRQVGLRSMIGRNWFASLLIALAVLTFARLTTAEKANNEAFSSSRLLDLAPEEVTPIARLEMPDIGLPETGTMIQLGIFSKLEGAERKQQEMSRKGFMTSIEKKVSTDNTQYAVLIGPFYGDKRKQTVSAQLEQAGISHFERPDSHY